MRGDIVLTQVEFLPTKLCQISNYNWVMVCSFPFYFISLLTQNIRPQRNKKLFLIFIRWSCFNQKNKKKQEKNNYWKRLIVEIWIKRKNKNGIFFFIFRLSFHCFFFFNCNKSVSSGFLFFMNINECQK